MKEVFADSSYFLALLDRRDAHHRHVLDFATNSRGPLVTTRWVLVEVANALGRSPVRAAAARMLQRVEDAGFRVILSSDRLYDGGLRFTPLAPTKSGSLTDCISFVVMADEGIAEALTGDRHFEQAGFRTLLA